MHAAENEAKDAFRRHVLTTGRSEQTAASYAANLSVFFHWCHDHNHDPLLPSRETAERYIADELARLSRNTVAARLAMLRAACRDAGQAGKARATATTL